jgi:hypothetical protein
MVSPSKQPTDADATSRKPRAVYKCSQCGVPAKGHDCPYKYPQRSSKTSPALEQRRKSPPGEVKEQQRRQQHQQQQSSNRAHAGRNTERGVNDNDDDESSFSLSTDPDERKVRHRRTSLAQHESRKSRKDTSSSTGTTEVLMALRIFQDQLNDHRQQQDLLNENNSESNDVEERFLTTWSQLASKKLKRQNNLVAENIQLVAQRKQLGKRVNKERDALVALRSKIRRVQAERTQLEHELSARRQQKSTRRAASRFLDALDRIACKK